MIKNGEEVKIKIRVEPNAFVGEENFPSSWTWSIIENLAPPHQLKTLAAGSASTFEDAIKTAREHARIEKERLQLQRNRMKFAQDNTYIEII